jgi:hypothetical protein
MLKQLVRDGDVTGFAKIPRRVSAKSTAQSRGVRRLGDPGHKPARCVAPDCNQLRATIFVTMAFPGNIPMTRQALSLHAAPTFGHGVDVGATTTARATTIGGPASLRSTREKVSYRVFYGRMWSTLSLSTALPGVPRSTIRLSGSSADDPEATSDPRCAARMAL